MKFRLEHHLTKDTVTAAEQTQSGLEAPESYFVELGVYQETKGAPNPEDVVFEWINGVQVAGVSWHYDCGC